MGYEGTEGLAQMVHMQGTVLSNPDHRPLVYYDKITMWFHLPMTIKGDRELI